MKKGKTEEKHNHPNLTRCKTLDKGLHTHKKNSPHLTILICQFCFGFPKTCSSDVCLQLGGLGEQNTHTHTGAHAEATGTRPNI